MPGGKFTDHVFGALKERKSCASKARLAASSCARTPPSPSCCWPRAPALRPIKALIEHMQFKGITRPTTLYWGGRRPGDLYLHDWVLARAAQMPNLRYVPVVSDALPEDAWTGRTGFVHQAVLQDFADLSGHQVYACGAPIVVDSARKPPTRRARPAARRVFCRLLHLRGRQARLNIAGWPGCRPLARCPSHPPAAFFQGGSLRFLHNGAMNRRNILLASAAAAAVFSSSLAWRRTRAHPPDRALRPRRPAGRHGPRAGRAGADSLGTVIIDNKGGAGGNIGADAMAKAAPDGLTIGIAATATHAVNPWLYARMPYDAAKDFAGITQMVRVPNVLVMNADKAAQLKINTLADLIAYAKANPAKLNYGSGGNGSAGHLAGEMFKQRRRASLPCTSPTTAATRRSWRCCRARWTSTSTTWPPPRPTSARQAQGPGRDHGCRPARPCPACHRWPARFKGFSIDTWWGLVAPAGTPKDGDRQAEQGLCGRPLNAPETK
jgi:hypothetical protein